MRQGKGRGGGVRHKGREGKKANAEAEGDKTGVSMAEKPSWKEANVGVWGQRGGGAGE